MNAKEFLKNKDVSLHSVNATRLPHKYKNIELELIPLMEEYAELRLSNVVGQSKQLKDFAEYLDKMGYSWNDFDRPHEMENLIEQYADEKANQALSLGVVSKRHLIEDILERMDGVFPDYHYDIVKDYLDDGC